MKHIYSILSFFLTVHCQWSEWSKVGSCSKTCGKGLQFFRRRKIVKAANGGNDCRGKEKGKEYCNTQRCPTNGAGSGFGSGYGSGSGLGSGSGCDIQCKSSR